MDLNIQIFSEPWVLHDTKKKSFVASSPIQSESWSRKRIMYLFSLCYENYTSGALNSWWAEFLLYRRMLPNTCRRSERFRKSLVMINFMCWLDQAVGCSETRAEHYFWMCLWDAFWMRLTLESVDWVCIGEGLIQFMEGLNKTKKAEEGRIHCFCCLTAWAGTLVSSCPQIGIYTTSSCGSQALGLRLDDNDRAFQGLQFADGRSWNFPAPIITRTNSA